VLLGHQNHVRGAAFASATSLVSCGRDGNVLLWQLPEEGFKATGEAPKEGDAAGEGATSGSSTPAVPLLRCRGTIKLGTPLVSLSANSTGVAFVGTTASTVVAVQMKSLVRAVTTFCTYHQDLHNFETGQTKLALDKGVRALDQRQQKAVNRKKREIQVKERAAAREAALQSKKQARQTEDEGEEGDEGNAPNEDPAAEEDEGAAADPDAQLSPEGQETLAKFVEVVSASTKTARDSLTFAVGERHAALNSILKRQFIVADKQLGTCPFVYVFPAGREAVTALACQGTNVFYGDDDTFCTKTMCPGVTYIEK